MKSNIQHKYSIRKDNPELNPEKDEIDPKQIPKILYKTFDVPDNYTNENFFLKNMKVNENVTKFPFYMSVEVASTISQNLSLLVLTFLTHLFLADDDFKFYASIFVLFAWIIIYFVTFKIIGFNIGLKWQSVPLFVLFSILFPVLYDFFADIDERGRYQVQLILFVFWIGSQSYNKKKKPNNVLIALVLIFVLSVEHKNNGFLLPFTLIATMNLVFLPKSIQNTSDFQKSLIYALFLMAMLTIFLVRFPIFALINVIIHSFILFCVPVILDHIYKNKLVIEGPWDVAIPT
eukprot:TRINITY_DN3256_c2_g1_i2.p1 TRINITY_DN3256_c2_g1~~TRINITY_DN3256_c2_g1_i2.p1  ORF type:complete len:290 (+),score=47.20 TRINITY_DN3256_c2_g1_i2:35-904(+)